MKTHYRFIHFVQSKEVWHCYANSNATSIGFCEYYARWRQWQFVPEMGTAFTADCLQDIAHFLGQLKGTNATT